MRRHRIALALFALATVAGGQSFAERGPNFAAPGESLRFDIFEVETPPARHQIVLPGWPDDSASSRFAVLGVAPDGAGRARLLILAGPDWRTTAEATLEPGVLFVDVARIHGQNRLLTYRRDGFHWFDADMGTEHPLIALTTSYRRGEDAGIPHLEVARDLNDDGRDDLLLPDLDGFWVAIQSQDGTFGEPVKVGGEEPFLDAKAYGDKRTYREVGIDAQNASWYLARAHRLDFDRDGRRDLAFWNGDHFLLYRQDAAGAFAATPSTFDTDVAFHFDGAYGLAFQFGDAGVAALLLGLRRRDEHTILHGFRDLDADGIADLITLTVSGRSPLRLRGRYDVHLGRPAPDGTAFPASPDTSVEAPGKSSGGQPWGYAAQRFLDYDGDGLIDTAMSAVNTSLGGMVRAMVANSISMELSLYGFRDGGYPAKPDWQGRVRTRFAPLDKRGPQFPTVLVGDVNGDGRSDLLTGERWDELRVYLGTAGPEPLATRPIKLRVAIPGNERNAQLIDLDRDGRDEVVIQHPSGDGRGRLLILDARAPPGYGASPMTARTR